MSDIFIDGAGFSPKLGLSRFCVYLDEHSKPVISALPWNLTNNEAEYLALLEGLNYAQKGDTIYTDSQLVYGHITQNWKVNYKHLTPYVEKAKQKVKELNITLKWIDRSQNKAGLVLEGKLK